MNFLGVGPAELIVVLVVALIFVGPERLPRLAADLARTIREIRQYTGGLAAEFNEVVKDFEKETEGERSQWKEIGEGIGGATRSVTEAIRDARADATGAAASTPAAPNAAPAADTPATAANGAPAVVPEWREITDTPPPANGAASGAVSTNGHAAAVAGVAPADDAL